MGVLTLFCSFWLIFYPLEPDPWIRIFLRIRIQEAKILRIQRIRIQTLSSKHCIFLIKEVPQFTKTEIKIHIVFLIQATRFM